MIDKDNYEKRWYECTDHNGNKFLCWPNAGVLFSVVPEIGRPFEFDYFVNIIESDRHPMREIVERLNKEKNKS
jgi:hypothetical protein